MAFGDIGGIVTELVITCKTPPTGAVALRKGDAVVLVGPYTVGHATANDQPLFGQVLADSTENDAAVPVKLRGICAFTYDGTAPVLDGVKGVTCAAAAGTVKSPASGNGRGLVLKVDSAASVVHVWL
jgi:hypothetical protein